MRLDGDYPEVIGNRSGESECGKYYGRCPVLVLLILGSENP
jgi:hypothetical protein